MNNRVRRNGKWWKVFESWWEITGIIRIARTEGGVVKRSLSYYFQLLASHGPVFNLVRGDGVVFNLHLDDRIGGELSAYDGLVFNLVRGDSIVLNLRLDDSVGGELGIYHRSV